MSNNLKTIHKSQVIEDLAAQRKSAIGKYQDFFVGKQCFPELLKFELIAVVSLSRSGALGYLLRKALLPRLIGKIEGGVQWGRNIALRHPYKMEIGEGAAFDDECLLDARGVEKGEFRIGKNALVARNSAIQAKTSGGFIDIGNGCSIGNNCTLTSAGGIRIGAHVGLGGHCYVGGARYQTDNPDIPMLKQPMYSVGPIEIGDNCWIGAGVRILDGVQVGSGCIIGAGAVLRENVPQNTVVTPHQKLVMLRREISESSEGK